MKNIFPLLLILLSLINSAKSEPVVIEIKLGEFYFNPDVIHLISGKEVTIKLTNEGEIEHEFMVVKMSAEPEGDNKGMRMQGMGMMPGMGMMHGDMPMMKKDGMSMMHRSGEKSFEDDFFEGVEIDYRVEGGTFESTTEHGTEIELEPGGRAYLSFIVPGNKKGEWTIGCFIPDHYEAGMKGLLIVE